MSRSCLALRWQLTSAIAGAIYGRRFSWPRSAHLLSAWSGRVSKISTLTSMAGGIILAHHAQSGGSVDGSEDRVPCASEAAGQLLNALTAPRADEVFAIEAGCIR